MIDWNKNLEWNKTLNSVDWQPSHWMIAEKFENPQNEKNKSTKLSQRS